MNLQMSPCMYCTRVADPRQCEDKNCKTWQAWFIGRWEALRMQPRLRIEKEKPEPEGVCIGGNHYALPHRVDSYLHKDPCDGCLCPRDTCPLPCRRKRAWLQARKDVFVS